MDFAMSAASTDYRPATMEKQDREVANCFRRALSPGRDGKPLE